MQNELERPRVQSVYRATQILLACATDADGLHARDIAEQVGLSRQATYHILHTLRQAGFIEKLPDQRFRLGLKVGVLTEALERQLAPPARLLPHLQALAADTGEACSVVGWHDGEPVVLAHAPGHHSVRVADVRTGQSGASHARASGKLLLALASQDLRKSYLSNHELKPLTANTITDVTDLESELKDIRAVGYAVDEEGYAEGICCVAVPVILASTQYALSVSAPADRFRTHFDWYLEAARREAKLAAEGA